MTCAEFAAMDAEGMAMAAEAVGTMSHDAMADDMTASIMRACEGMEAVSVMEAMEAAM